MTEEKPHKKIFRTIERTITEGQRELKEREAPFHVKKALDDLQEDLKQRMREADHSEIHSVFGATGLITMVIMMSLMFFFHGCSWIKPTINIDKADDVQACIELGSLIIQLNERLNETTDFAEAHQLTGDIDVAVKRWFVGGCEKLSSNFPEEKKCGE